MAYSTDAHHATADQFLESLERLSRKPGVLATIVLDRATGAILKTTGNTPWAATSRATAATSDLIATDEESRSAKDNGEKEQMAAMIWKFVNGTAALVQGLDTEDDVKLLRLRTKKHELVIVPDVKYILVVVHETSPA